MHFIQRCLREIQGDLSYFLKIFGRYKKISYTNYKNIVFYLLS